MNDTVVVCGTNNSFYINAADDPYFQSYLWSTSSTDTAVNFTAVLPDTNSIYLTVQTRTAPSCTLKDTLFLIQNSTLQVDLNVSPTANDICASTAFIDTLNCTNSSALLGTYQFSTHFNSDAPTFLNNAGSNPLQLIDTIDLSTHAGGTISFLVSYNAVSGNATNFGCAVVSDSLTLAIHAQPTASLHTLDSSLYCVGATLTTVATSSGGTGSPSYQWSAIGTVLNQNQDSLVLQDISVVPGPIAIQYIYSTNGPGCISDTVVYTEQLLSRPLVQVSTFVIRPIFQFWEPSILFLETEKPEPMNGRGALIRERTGIFLVREQIHFLLAPFIFRVCLERILLFRFVFSLQEPNRNWDVCLTQQAVM